MQNNVAINYQFAIIFVSAVSRTRGPGCVASEDFTMSNSDLGFLEVLVKRVESDSDSDCDYETAVDLVHSSWTNSSCMLQVDVYDGLLIEISICDTVTRYSELWPEENYASHPSNREPSVSRTINAVIYDSEMEYLHVNLSDDVVLAMIQAINDRTSRTVMVPFPRVLINQLFNHAFNIYLAKRINAWKQAA